MSPRDSLTELPRRPSENPTGTSNSHADDSNDDLDDHLISPTVALHALFGTAKKPGTNSESAKKTFSRPKHSFVWAWYKYFFFTNLLWVVFSWTFFPWVYTGISLGYTLVLNLGMLAYTIGIINHTFFIDLNLGYVYVTAIGMSFVTGMFREMSVFGRVSGFD